MGKLPPPPQSGPHGQDLVRIERTRLARRVLHHEHRDDAAKRLIQRIGITRKEAWGLVDPDDNFISSVYGNLSRLYDEAPYVMGDGADLLQEVTRQSKLWPMMRTVQHDAMGLVDGWVRVTGTLDPTTGAPKAKYEQIYPDLVCIEADPDQPSEAVKLWVAVPRPLGGKTVWTWDEVDLSDPLNPSYRILHRTGGTMGQEGVLEDLTALYMPDLSGPWPDHWRDSQGRPVSPYVRYRSAITREDFGWRKTQGLVSVTLELACYHAALDHSIYMASWAQRYAAGLTLPDAAFQDENGDGTGRNAVIPDPTTVLLFSQSEDATSPAIGQWSAPTSPTEIMEVIERRQRMALANAGLDPSDVLRASGDPKSGYALSIGNSAKRQKQMEVAPLFEASDLELLRATACQLNRLLGSEVFPESGISITYRGIPLSAEERQAQRVDVTERLNAGLISPIDAYRTLNPGVSEADAARDLARIRGQRRAYDPGSAMAPGAVASLLSMVAQVQSGAVPRESAVAIARTAYRLSDTDLAAIFG